MLFMNFSTEGAESFTSKYRDVAEQFKGQGIGFLMGDLEAGQGAFQVSIFLIFLSSAFNAVHMVILMQKKN